MLSNVKVQANKLFSVLKDTPVAKGLGSALKEENLVRNAQTKILSQIEAESRNIIDSAPKIYDETSAFIEKQTGVKATSKMSDISKSNIEKMSNVNLDESVNDTLLSVLDKRFKNSPEMLARQRQAVVQNATSKAATLGSSIDSEGINSLLTESAREVDAKMASMTPMYMAKEYYGKPISETINSIQSNSLSEDSLLHFGKATARIAGTGAVLGVGVGAVNVATGVTTTAINKLKGDSYER